MGWYTSNTNDTGTRPVRQKDPNGLGLYDMSGNVYEWCSDWYGSNYYASSLGQNPRGPDSGSNRVLRGGSWSSNAEFCRSAGRNDFTPDFRNDDLGFRPVFVP